MAGVGAVLASFSVAPLAVWALYLAVDRYLAGASTLVRTWTIAGFTILVSAYFGLQCYRCFCKFSPHRHTLHPAWVAPRICLFLELHPVWGLLIPVTAMLRGFHAFAFARWAFNLTAVCFFLMNDAILLPAWREACCYGEETLTEGKESCEKVSFSAGRGLELCSEKSDTHIQYEKLAWAFVTLSAALQLCNVMTITWSVKAQVIRIVRKTIDGKIRIVGHEDETINMHEILRLMGMPLFIEKEVFSNVVASESEGQLAKRIHRMHHHPHWCQSGLYRLLALDPILGYTLSLHDFLGYTNTRGTLRIIANFFGAALIFLSAEVLQPMHLAWCCYGAGSYTDQHVFGEYYTCEEWLLKYYGPEKDTRIPSPYEDSDVFPNGSCLRHHSIGLAAALAFLGGFALIFTSTMVWVFSVEAAGEAEMRAARRLFRRVIPSQRFLLLQAMDLMGINHGYVRIKKDKKKDKE